MPRARLGRRPKRKPGGTQGRLKRITPYTRAKANELCLSNRSPLDVMIENMEFWRKAAVELGERLDGIISKNKFPKSERIQFLKLLRDFIDARSKAQSCAVDAAPYVHPKLSSIAMRPVGSKDIKLISQEMTQEEAAAAWAATLAAGPVIDVSPVP